MAIVSDYTALLSGASWTGGPAGQAVLLTYSFSTVANPDLQGTDAALAPTFKPLTEARKTAVRAALAQWSAASGVVFKEVTATTGDLTFGTYKLATNIAGEGNYPSSGAYVDASGRPQIYAGFASAGGDIYFDNSYNDPGYDTDFAHVAIHEIGHALGLKHPFDGTATLTPSMDTGSNTVMSYNGARLGTLGPLDIAAVQYLYGTPASATHPFAVTWNPATESVTEIGTSAAQVMFGTGGNDVFLSNGGRDAISGGQGNDLFYANGTPISINGGPGTDRVATGLAWLPNMVIGGSGTYRWLSLPAYADSQIYVDVEFLDFTNGVYSTATNTFTTTQPGLYLWTAMVDAAWSTPGNWRPVAGGNSATAPGAADTAVLAGTLTLGSASVYRLQAGAASASLAAGAQFRAATGLTLAGGSLGITAAGAVLEVGSLARTPGTGGALFIDASASISGFGRIAASTIAGSGTIAAAGGTLRVEAGSTAPMGWSIAAGATLSASTLSGIVTFGGANAALALDAPAAASAVTLVNFGPGDRIAIGQGPVPYARYTATGTATGTLSVGSMSFTMAGDYSQVGFRTALDAAGTLTISAVAKVDAEKLFDARYYLEHNPDVAAAGIDPYQHYTSIGWTEGRNPSALFNTSYYLKQNPDVAALRVNPLEHYATTGWHELRNPNPWFDTRFYLAQNPDVAAYNVNPLLHFSIGGWREGRDPSLAFSDGAYLAANPDVRAAGVNPLASYIEYGQASGRMAFMLGGTMPQDALVDPAYYDRQLKATIVPAGDPGWQQATYSYAQGGWQLGLNPDAWFDTQYYLAHNPDVAAAHVNPMVQYETVGWLKGADPSAQFSTSKYLGTYTDVAAAGMNPLVHFMIYGRGEGRVAFAV